MSEVASTVDGKKDQYLDIQPVFSQEGLAPDHDIKYEKRAVTIKDESGKVIFHQDEIEVPSTWSDMAARVVASKYFYGKGRSKFNETSVKQLIHRVCRTIADWGVADGYFDKTKGETFYKELYSLCIHQYGAFNSPVWFNLGLYHQYGIGMESQGGFALEKKSGKFIRWPNQYERAQCSACFIVSVDDNMDSIMKLAATEAALFKFGSGTGTNLSSLRSTRETIRGGGVPSGPLSFLKIYDQVANVVKSGGISRRAAKINLLDADHPDIEEFIESKKKEEKKAHALIDAGYEGNFNGEAYSTVAFQNENLSVRAGDAFMLAAVEKREWQTHTVQDKLPCEKKDAATLLQKISEGTHFCGDPGLQFDDTIHTWHTCKGTSRQRSSNPCAEFTWIDNSACNLASINVKKFVNLDGLFDDVLFSAAVRIFTIAQDIIVDNASYPTPEIADNSHRFRTLGLGYGNIGALIMSLGIPYDSDEARGVVGSITALLTGTSYSTSCDMAKVLGPFKGLDNPQAAGHDAPLLPSNRESMMDVMKLHRSHVGKIYDYSWSDNIKIAAKAAWDKTVYDGAVHGWRNAQTTVLAPTGTISFLMDADTTGIEPDLALVKYKQLAGRGMFKIVNMGVEAALERLGYDPSTRKMILDHIQKFDTIEDVTDNGVTSRSGLKSEHLPVFDCAFKPKLGTRSIHWTAHIKVLAAAQPFISGSISKTINMPKDSTVEDIKNAYVMAWKMGLKCVAIYRDGSKRSQPLSTSKDQAVGSNVLKELEDKVTRLESEIVTAKTSRQPVRRRLPDTRNAINHKFSVAGHEGYITVGLYEDGTPGEMFITMAKEGSTIGGLMDTIATLVSLSLQHGVPLETLVKKFLHQRFEPSGFTTNPEIRQASSLIDYIFHWVQMEFSKVKEQKSTTVVAAATTSISIPNGKTSILDAAISHFQADAPTCSECGHITVRNGACYKCLNCGGTLGCS